MSACISARPCRRPAHHDAGEPAEHDDSLSGKAARLEGERRRQERAEELAAQMDAEDYGDYGEEAEEAPTVI